MKKIREDILVAFKKDLWELCYVRGLFAIGFVVFFNLSFSLADYLYFSGFNEKFQKLLWVRLTGEFFAIICFICLAFFKNIFNKHANTIVLITGFFMSVEITYMCYVTGGFNSDFYFGYMFMIIGTGLWMPWGGLNQFFIGLYAQLIYLSQYFWIGNNAVENKFLVHNFFIGMVTVLTSAIATIQYRLNLKLKEKEAYKTDFFNNMSHEFKTPLSLVILPLKRMIGEKTWSIQENDLLDTALKNAQKIQSLIQTLLDTTKIEAGRMPLRVQSFYPRLICENLLSRLKPVLQEKGLTSTFTTNDNPEVYADLEMFERIMENLYSNAIKFSDKKGTNIETTILDQNHRIFFKIKDYGIGLEHSETKKVFDRFYQSSLELTREHSGTGIGLHYARELVRLHQGELSVQSQKGQWTEFSFSLKKGNAWFNKINHVVVLSDQKRLDHQTSVSMNTSPAENKPISTKRSEKIASVLVVEDNEELNMHITSLLSEKYAVTQAFNGEEGVKMAREHLPDLILTDLMMPKMSGHTLIETIRSDSLFTTTPIIILTAHGDEPNAVVEGFRLGANDYLTKPFGPEELMVRIDNLITLKKKKDELEKMNKKLKETQAELVRAETLSAVGELAAGVAHNVNTYMSGADMGLTLILDQFQDNNKVLRQTAEAALTSIRNTKFLVKTLENFSQKNKEGYALVDLKEGLQTVTHMIRFQPKGQSVNFHSQFSLNSRVYCNLQQMQSVFLNLFKNALQAEAKNIWIQFYESDNEVVLEFKDDGCGMSDEIKQKIFEPFFTTKDVEKGSGLGLWMVYRTIQEHGGRINVFSKVNKGTTFELRFPHHRVS